MYQSTISHSKSAFSSLVDQARAGESIIITDRDVPVAMLTPVNRQEYRGAAILADFERQGLIRRGTGGDKPVFDDLPPETLLIGTLAALLDERADAR